MPATTPDLSSKVKAAISAQWPTAEFVQKAAYERVSLPSENGTRALTLGYLYSSAAVETADGHGGWTYTKVHKAADVRKAVAAMKAVEKAATKKAAAKKS